MKPATRQDALRLHTLRTGQTLTDVAQAAELHETTVSRALRLGGSARVERKVALALDLDPIEFAGLPTREQEAA